MTGWIPLRWPALFAGLLGIALWVSQPGLENGWFYDDLHTIRDLTGAELEAGLTGTYDPDEVETPGWRPLLSPLNDLRYSLFEENHEAHRLAMIAALAAALTLLAAAMAVVGVSPVLTAVACAFVLTAKNASYSLTWITDGYHDVQVLAFAAALFLVALASRSRASRPGLLAIALALWCVTLGLKDQAVVLLPILVGFPVGARLLATAPPAEGYRRLVSDVAVAARTVWRRVDLRLFIVASIAIAVVDLVLRRIFVPSAPSGLGFDSFRHFAAQVRYVVELAGSDPFSGVYLGVAALAAILVLCWPMIERRRAIVSASAYWRVALLSGVAMISAAGFSLIAARSDLVLFPLIFYAIFICSAAVLGWRLARRLGWRIAIGAAACCLGALSVAISVAASRGVQDAMSPWSVQTLDFNYQSLLGADAEGLTIPPERRAEELGRLRVVGVSGYIGPGAYSALVCAHRARVARGRESRLVFPDEYFLGEDDVFPPPEPHCP